MTTALTPCLLDWPLSVYVCVLIEMVCVCLCVWILDWSLCVVFDWVKIWQQVRVVCLVSVCVCMWEEDLDHPTITHWPACYKASRPHSTPWVKFTGLAIMGVNNPVLSVTVLPVLSSTQHPSLENRHRPPTPLIYHLYPIWGIMIFFLPPPPPLFPISSVSLSLPLTSGFTSVLSFFFFISRRSDQCRGALSFTLNWRWTSPERRQPLHPIPSQFGVTRGASLCQYADEPVPLQWLCCEAPPALYGGAPPDNTQI